MPISPPDGYQGGPVRAMGMATDAEGNIWISSVGDNSVYVFKHGNPQQSVAYNQDLGSRPFDIALAADGSAWVSNGLGPPPSTIAKYALVGGTLVQQFRHLMGDQLRGVALDSHGNAWLASQGDDLVYALRPDGTVIGSFHSGGIYHPWGMAVDGEDNVWVANFGPLELGNNFTGRLTKLWGVNAPPGHVAGDPISPPTGYTLPSAGSQVLLHNGTPLYGPPPAPPSFIPMMRQTALGIDQAGNIWSLNNWKPDFTIDSVGGNPGGDGIIIFVGLAPPRSDH
jgi:streptogramin lyase